MAETGLQDSAGRPMRHGRIRATGTGLATVVHNGQAAKTAGHIGAQAQVLAGLLGVHSVRTRRLDSARTLVMINTRDPLAGRLTLDQLPQVHTDSQVPLGLSEDMEPILWNAGNSTLLLGSPGAGKSSVIWVILDGIQRWRDQPKPLIAVVDLKEGVELSALDPARGGIADWFISDPKEAEKMIDNLRRIGRERLQLMRQHDIRRWKPRHAELIGPRIILIIDEFLALPKKITDPERGVLKEVLYLLPGAGITVLGCSQLTQVDTSAVGRVRNLFTDKILLAVESVGMTVAALGDEARVDAPAHLLQLPYDAGRFYMKQEGRSGFVSGKAAFVDDEANEHLPIARGELVSA